MTADWLAGQLPQMERALQSLVETNSFTQNRDGGNRVGEQLVKLFAGCAHREIGSEQFSSHHIFETRGAPHLKTIGLIGHLDTVFPPGYFEGYEVDGALRRGPGVLDMKGGLVVMSWAIQALIQEGVLSQLPSLKMVIVSDEEVGSPEGAPLIARELRDWQCALVFESGRENDAVVTQRKGTGSLTLKAQGKAAHAGNAYWQGANAIWGLSRAVDKIQQLSSKETATTVNVGRIQGGTARNTVPEEASAEVDLRYQSVAAEAELRSKLSKAVDEIAIDGVSIRIEEGSRRPPMEKKSGTDALLQKYFVAARKYGLRATEADLQGGGSDGNTTTFHGIPTLDALGPRGRHFHTKQEYIEVDSLLQRAQALVEFIKSCAT